jgi:ribosomal protein S18 acetylase RimI-like enzyme
LLRVLDEPTLFYVVGFYVLPTDRGRGLGRELLGLLSEESRGLGAEGLLLTVSPANVAALELYKSAGFVEEAFVADFYGEGEDRFILRKHFQETGLQGGVS